MVRAVLKSYRKNILREMKDNLSRMVSLFGIVALGVMMLTGLMSFAPSMRIAGQKYYVQQNVFDLRVLSTLGLSEEDIAAIAAVAGEISGRGGPVAGPERDGGGAPAAAARRPWGRHGRKYEPSGAALGPDA